MVNFGQIICGLIAIDPIVAQNAIKLIHVQYEELKPIITIEVCNPYNIYPYNVRMDNFINARIVKNCKKFKR